MVPADWSRRYDAHMWSHIRNNIVGYVAVFLALSGGAYALQGKNTVDSGDIKKGQVKKSDLAKNAVRSPTVKDESLTGDDISEGSLGQVPSAASAATAETLAGVGAADLYTKAEADSRFLSSTADTELSISPFDWINITGAIPVDYGLNSANFGSSSAPNAGFLAVGLDLPRVIAGQFQAVKSVEVCYGTAPGLNVISDFTINATESTNTAPDEIATPVFTDSDDSTGDECRTLTPPSPIAIDPESYFDLVLRGDYTANSTISIHRTTVTLTPVS
jgi:hypothetical protein